MPALTFLSPYLYSDAIKMVADAENARRSTGCIHSEAEERYSRNAWLLLAVAFEAFVNEEAQQAGFTEDHLKKIIDERLKTQKGTPPADKRNFPRTLSKFVILCEHRMGKCPNFCAYPFSLLIDLLEHRNQLVHYSMTWEPAYRLETGSSRAGIRQFHYYEIARDAAYYWYQAVKWYYNEQGVQESPNADYCGMITSYQIPYLHLLKKKRQKATRAPELVNGLVLASHEELRRCPISYKNCQTYEYWDKLRFFTVLITLVPEQVLELETRKVLSESVELQVRVETSRFPAGSKIEPVDPIKAPDLISGLNELLPKIRESFVPPPEDWWNRL